jgi:hypothetical protein
MTLRAVQPVASHPSWDDVWNADDLAHWIGVNVATVYAAIKAGEYDFARIPAGRAIRFSGPALAARFGVPGYGEGVQQTGT